LNIDNLKISFSSKQYPFILKPDREGNSRGLSESCVVNDFEALQKQLMLMLTKYHSILIEQFLGNAPDLQEYTIAMIGNKENRLLMPAQIQLKTPKKIRVITTQDKDETHTQATPVQDVNMREKLVAFARRAFDSAEYVIMVVATCYSQIMI
jgi:D-alanine-D-alanine ligase-like ATP-grasp enzyme